MRFIKKFEELDFSQTVPMASRSVLTMYYSCDDCDDTWKEFNKQCNECPNCKSKNIEELSKEEWYEVVKSRSDDKEIYDIEDEMEEDEEFVDLEDLGENDEDKYVN